MVPGSPSGSGRPFRDARGVGLMGWPVGAYVIADGAVTWRPAINVNLLILGGQLVAVAAIWALRSVLKARVKTMR